MKKILTFVVAAFALVSCNQAAKMAELADQVKINCDPEVLEVVGGFINADVAVTFPAEWFHPKAKVVVTPVIVYQGGEAVGTPFVYQGEKVTENYKTVSKDGATISEHVTFDYVPGMEKSQLIARATVYYNNYEVNFPNDIKIADGANTTYMLVCKDGTYEPMKDKYQEVIPEDVEAQILYLINSSNVRSTELNSKDIKAYQESMKNVMNDERRTIKGTEIVAYASPDGPEKLNNKLSSSREESASKAFKTVAKKLETGDVNAKSIGEDWAGFQELVNASNIEDKELILRVLSMYSDPAVREREIKNMSSVYKSLANNVLPALRRARFITSVEYQNYTPEELADLVENNIDVLDEEALLRAAANTKDNKLKLTILKQAINKYNSERAKFNSACVYMDQEKESDAKAMLDKMSNKDQCCVNNMYGVIAMRAGENDKAASYFAKVKCSHGAQNAAVLDILNGNYAEAAKKLSGSGNCNEALALILTNQLDKAEAAIKGSCAKCSYKKAIIAARKGDAAKANAELAKVAKDEALAKRAITDIEFAKIR
ncbi:MAG: hypothetical protein HUJ92_08865 [Bacteroidales bacterium]|nr:hypothetical protein [Bacteroidales bacterium]